MKKIDYKHGTFIIATTSSDGFSYEDYVEDCEVNGYEPEDEDSEGFLNWCYEEARDNFEADLDCISYCKEYNIPVVVSGHLGLWWGHPEIEPTRFESVAEAIERCMKGADYVDIKYDDGEIIVYATHHDGTNVFTINALSKKGIVKKNAEYKSHDVKRLPYLYAIGV